MILLIGGMGFIGMHTAELLLDAGESVVLTVHRARREPSFLTEHLGTRAFVEQYDVASDDLRPILQKHKVEVIVNLVAPPVGQMSPEDEYHTNMAGLINTLTAAKDAGVRRTLIGSSGSVYMSVPQGPYSEDQPLPLGSRNSTEAYKKAMETLTLHYADRTGIEVGTLRLGHIYGPRYYSMVNLPSRLCHAAVKGVAPDFGRAGPPYAEDEGDFTYVRDCAKGIQLLAMAPKLSHRVYNIGGGTVLTNQDILDALHQKLPEAQGELKPGRGPAYRSNPLMRLDHIQQDTSYQPEYTIERAISEYVEWLRENAE